MKGAAIADWVWESTSVGARLSRAVLAPASALFGAAVYIRNEHFDSTHATTSKRGALRTRPTVLPALSVGNLTVGGTGKTPVAAWCAHELQRRGARPAIILRGYGDDEWKVHALLNPGVPVVVSPDRLMGITRAGTMGANCAVMDDAFQHRQAARLSDLVLVSADRWNGTAHLLPRGPFREPLSALRRATVVVITVKASDKERVQQLEGAITAAAPDVSVSVLRLVLGPLRLATTLPALTADVAPPGRKPDRSGLLQRPVDWLSGRRLLAVSAIGDPRSFTGQLEQAGAHITPRRFRDHHDFTVADAEAIARDAEGLDGVVCTLKDAVKLGAIWPRVAPPLWYVSQQVVVERGALVLDRALARVLVDQR
ncbi:MAG: tetraacyldisaccharide 4'-kinase [Phycisphaerae bacterium]|nr:tetraacyldisaccharide 4'-kinase [Gemmatimonadaceae bacterium]